MTDTDTDTDPALQALIDRVRAARAAGTALDICGGGTKAFYGEAPQGEPLHTAALAGISSYEPSELVVTARAGTPLLELEMALAEKGQCLPFEPPHFITHASSGATVGGMVAAGLSGPSRASGRGARLRARCEPAQRPRRGVELRRAGDEERGGLRRVAPAGRLARHAGCDPGGVAQGAAHGAGHRHAAFPGGPGGSTRQAQPVGRTTVAAEREAWWYGTLLGVGRPLASEIVHHHARR